MFLSSKRLVTWFCVCSWLTVVHWDVKGMFSCTPECQLLRLMLENKRFATCLKAGTDTCTVITWINTQRFISAGVKIMQLISQHDDYLLEDNQRSMHIPSALAHALVIHEHVTVIGIDITVIHIDISLPSELPYSNVTLSSTVPPLKRHSQRERTTYILLQKLLLFATSRVWQACTESAFFPLSSRPPRWPCG